MTANTERTGTMTETLRTVYYWPSAETDTPPTVADRLDALRAELAKLHAEAEATRLPQGVVMGLHWLIEDAASTLAHLRGMMAEREAERAMMAAEREAPPA